jgi:hypothetical protein
VHRGWRRAPTTAEELWRCCRCQRYLPVAAYYEDRSRGTPVAYCKPCGRFLRDLWVSRQASGSAPGWARRQRARRAKHRRQRALEATEVSELARALLATARRHGLTAWNVAGITGTTCAMQKKLERGAAVVDLPKARRMLDKLVVLAQVCRDYPQLDRGRGGKGHPHLAEITARYRALRAAQA